MALKAFGLSSDAPAANLELVKGKDSRLVGARIMEDAVIEHDARSVPAYKLVGSDMTGRAMFRNGAQTLEVITANRNKLEEAFGVDLIYVNHSRSNVVMVQYKMLRPTQSEANDTWDWVYTQDRHLAKQMKAMERFASHRDCQGPYRLSHEIFYFKFIRRYGASKTSSVLIPLEHLQELMRDQKHNGRSGSLRLGYNALEGRYMRQSAFYNLLQSGYIGAGTSTTNALTTLIQDLLRGGDALVLAIQRETTQEEDDSDRERAIGLWNDRGAGVH
ncbi:hypothetical protein J7E62_30245 [Variovorax paradoxus]|nr:hypothetical protein [Variovorax paradoxus]